MNNVIRKLKNWLARKLLGIEDNLEYVIVPKYKMDRIEPIRKKIYKLFPDEMSTPLLANVMHATDGLWDLGNRKFKTM